MAAAAANATASTEAVAAAYTALMSTAADSSIAYGARHQLVSDLFNTAQGRAAAAWSIANSSTNAAHVLTLSDPGSSVAQAANLVAALDTAIAVSAQAALNSARFTLLALDGNSQLVQPISTALGIMVASHAASLATEIARHAAACAVQTAATAAAQAIATASAPDVAVAVLSTAAAARADADAALAAADLTAANALLAADQTASNALDALITTAAASLSPPPPMLAPPLPPSSQATLQLSFQVSEASVASPDAVPLLGRLIAAQYVVSESLQPSAVTVSNIHVINSTNPTTRRLLSSSVGVSATVSMYFDFSVNVPLRLESLQAHPMAHFDPAFLSSYGINSSTALMVAQFQSMTTAPPPPSFVPIPSGPSSGRCLEVVHHTHSKSNWDLVPCKVQTWLQQSDVYGLCC